MKGFKADLKVQRNKSINKFPYIIDVMIMENHSLYKIDVMNKVNIFPCYVAKLSHSVFFELDFASFLTISKDYKLSCLQRKKRYGHQSFSVIVD